MGMTRWFQETGGAVSVTAIKIPRNRVVQIKTQERDSYSAIQLTAVGVLDKKSRIGRPRSGHLAAYQAEEGGRWLAEFRTDADPEWSSGDEISASDLFETGHLVDVSGVTKGKGFAGVIKRWNFKTQDATHGNSLSHRAPGSIGQCQTPGKVWKGKKMAGRMGGSRQTVQNLEIVDIDSEYGIILVRGAVPGAVGARVTVRPAVKSRKK